MFKSYFDLQCLPSPQTLSLATLFVVSVLNYVQMSRLKFLMLNGIQWSQLKVTLLTYYMRNKTYPKINLKSDDDTTFQSPQDEKINLKSDDDTTFQSPQDEKINLKSDDDTTFQSPQDEKIKFGGYDPPDEVCFICDETFVFVEDAEFKLRCGCTRPPKTDRQEDLLK